MGFFTGTRGGYEQTSLLRPSQEPLAQQAINAGLQKGAGGAFGDVADYYRQLLSNTSEDFNAFANPELRQFREQIIPSLAMQFAGMGAGDSGLTGSGFRNAAVSAGADLSERLGAIRANLRQQAAQGLMNVGQQGLQQFSQTSYSPPTAGLLERALPAIGGAIGSFGTPLLGGIGAGLGEIASNWIKKKGSTAPYGSPSAARGLSYMLPKGASL